jgi:hypothetical protein
MDEIVIGSTYTLPSGSVLSGNLLAIGGKVVIEEGALVDGDLLAFGTDLTVDGEIDGSLIALGASVSLEENAVIQGDLIVPQSALYRSSEAVVNGQVITEAGPVKIVVPETDIEVPTAPLPVRINMNPFAETLTFMLQAFAFSALAVVVVIFMPKRLEYIAEAVVSQPLVTGGLGLLTAVAFPVLMIMVMLLSLLILTPVSILGMVTYAIALVLGWVALGFELGKRIEVAFKQDWTAALQTGIGTFVLTLVVGIINLIPCIGWLVGFMIASIGLGGVVVTRLGGQEYLGPAVLSDEIVDVEEDTE